MFFLNTEHLMKQSLAVQYYLSCNKIINNLDKQLTLQETLQMFILYLSYKVGKLEEKNYDYINNVK